MRADTRARMAKHELEIEKLKTGIVELVCELRHTAQLEVLAELRDIIAEEVARGNPTAQASAPPSRAPKKRKRLKTKPNGVTKRAVKTHPCPAESCAFIARTRGGLGVHRARKHSSEDKPQAPA